MPHVVITGATRGIGKALAGEFLKRNCRVTICGRNPENLRSALRELREGPGNRECEGFTLDVTIPGDMETLWQEAALLAPVDIWINNAGVNHINYPFHRLDSTDICAVTGTNIRGVMLGSFAALRGMLDQGSGSLYNMEGFGSDGRIMKGMSIYGTSKYAISYFTRSLVKEYRDSGILVGRISPGMLVTDMLLDPIRRDPASMRQALKVFHILADPVDRVAPWLAESILANHRHGARIRWLTRSKITARFLVSLFRKRKVAGLPGML